MGRYFIGTYTDGPMLWYQIIDRNTQEIIRRFPNRKLAEVVLAVIQAPYRRNK